MSWIIRVLYRFLLDFCMFCQPYMDTYTLILITLGFSGGVLDLIGALNQACKLVQVVKQAGNNGKKLVNCKACLRQIITKIQEQIQRGRSNDLYRSSASKKLMCWCYFQLESIGAFNPYVVTEPDQANISPMKWTMVRQLLLASRESNKSQPNNSISVQTAPFKSLLSI